MATIARMDLAEFNRAMDLAVVYSSRDRQVVANSKLKDWMIKAMKAAKQAKRQAILDVITSRKFIAWYTTRRLGGKGWIDEDFEDSRKMLRRRLSAVGFVKSGFVKSANKFPKVDPSRPGKQRITGAARLNRGFNRTVKATVRPAKPKQKASASTVVTWEQRESPAVVNRIVDQAVKSGLLGMVRDTKRHVEKKMGKSLKQISYF